jgi:hypothetical protein
MYGCVAATDGRARWPAGVIARVLSSSEVLREVPYDPEMQFVFFGEEATMAARMHTCGYTFFAPTCAVVFHLWDRSYRPSFREIEGQLPRRQAGEQRVLEQLRHTAADADADAAAAADAAAPRAAADVDAAQLSHGGADAGAAAEGATPDGAAAAAGSSCSSGELRPRTSAVAMWGTARTAGSYGELCGVDFARGVVLAGCEEHARYGGQPPHAFVPDDSGDAEGLLTP